MSHSKQNPSRTKRNRTASLFYTSIASLTMFVAAPLHAEGLDRVYQVQAEVVPSTLVSKIPPAPTLFNFNLSPNNRRKTARIGVDQGDKDYKINLYTLRVHLHPNSDGSTDNGTLNYSLSANTGHITASHTTSMLPHMKGNIPLHNGEGEIHFPNGKYFSGSMKIHAIASKF